jgi:hypothetical protein
MIWNIHIITSPPILEVLVDIRISGILKEEKQRIITVKQRRNNREAV